MSCNNQETEPEATKAEPAEQKVALPYTASYSASFEIGNAAYSAKVLQGSWKDW
jgi:hypothetical protein